MLHVCVIDLLFELSSSDSSLHIDQLGDKSDELRVQAVFLLLGNWGISFNLFENLKNKIYVFCWSLDVHCLSVYILYLLLFKPKSFFFINLGKLSLSGRFIDHHSLRKCVVIRFDLARMLLGLLLLVFAFCRRVLLHPKIFKIISLINS